MLITRAWSDWIDVTVDLHLFVVTPRPWHDHHDVVARVILVQRPLPHFKSLHVSVWDNEVNDGSPRSWVLMFHNQINIQTGINIMGYAAFSQPTLPGAWCSLWHGDREITVHDDFAVSHDLSLSLMVQRPVLGQQGLWEGEEHLQLLQTAKIGRTLQVELLVHDTDTSASTAVKLIASVLYLTLPQFIEVPSDFDSAVLERELRSWGHDCICATFVDYHVAVCYPAAVHRDSRPKLFLYVVIDALTNQDVIVDDKVFATTELEHMRRLYSRGFWRACLRDPVILDNFPAQLFPCHNCEVTGQISKPDRKQLPWPDRLPCRTFCGHLLMQHVFLVPAPPASYTLM